MKKLQEQHRALCKEHNELCDQLYRAKKSNLNDFLPTGSTYSAWSTSFRTSTGSSNTSVSPQYHLADMSRRIVISNLEKRVQEKKRTILALEAMFSDELSTPVDFTSMFGYAVFSPRRVYVASSA